MHIYVNICTFMHIRIYAFHICIYVNIYYFILIVIF
jgi:hypothetical protein